MTLIRGDLRDVSGTPVDGVLHVRAATYRTGGGVTVSTDVSTSGVDDGVLAAQVSPGLTQFTLIVGGVRREWIANIPDTASVGLGDLLGDL